MGMFSNRAKAAKRAPVGEPEFVPQPGDVVAGVETNVDDDNASSDAVVDTKAQDVKDIVEAVVAAKVTANEPVGDLNADATEVADKVKRVKAVKPPKAAKPMKMKKVVEEEISLPLTCVIDFYQGVTKEREAEQIARAFIENNFDAPNASYIYIQKWREGIAVEMQEGGGRAYLPEVLAKLDEDPTATIALGVSNRFAQVRLDPDTKALDTLMLIEGQLPSEGSFFALATRPMQPLDKRGSRVFIAGVGLLATSAIAMIFSVGAFFIDTGKWALPYLAQTSVKDLPSAHTRQLEQALASGDCVTKMEYKDGQWTVLTGWNNGGVCGSTRPVAVPEAVAGLDPGVGAQVSAPMPQPVPGAAPTMPGMPASPPTAGVPPTGPSPFPQPQQR